MAAPSRPAPPRQLNNHPVVSAADAARLFLHAQGLCLDPARPASPHAIAQIIEMLGFVQVDTISTIERAHHHILHSRAHDYRQPMLAHLLEADRSLFEHWTHDASIIPLLWFPNWKPRFARHARRAKSSTWWKSALGPRPSRTIAHVLARIEREGPLMSRHFEHPTRQPGKSGWWNWKPHKAALEFLWRTGKLSIAARRNFQKVYDLTPRVFPQHHALPGPSAQEHLDWACSTALDRLGCATPVELAAFWKSIDLPSARKWCRAGLRAGSLVHVTVQSLDPAQPSRDMLAPADWPARLEHARSADPPRQIRILNPFDPLLRDRKRLRRLFNFDYAFEAFTPAARRRFGYYVLPLLRGQTLVGRIDAAMNRAAGTLHVNQIWWEPRIKPTRTLRHELHAAAASLAQLAGGHSAVMPK